MTSFFGVSVSASRWARKHSSWSSRPFLVTLDDDEGVVPHALVLERRVVAALDQPVAGQDDLRPVVGQRRRPRLLRLQPAGPDDRRHALLLELDHVVGGVLPGGRGVLGVAGPGERLLQRELPAALLDLSLHQRRSTASARDGPRRRSTAARAPAACPCRRRCRRSSPGAAPPWSTRSSSTGGPAPRSTAGSPRSCLG